MRLASCRLDGCGGHEAGRRLLRQLYKEEAGGELPTILITDTGYPYFADSPYYFSITHTNRHAFCVLAKEPVGIDAEELDRKVHPRVARRVLSEPEWIQFEKAPDKARAMLTFWVLKEAEAKLSGLGLRGFPNYTKFSLDDPRVTEWDGCLVAVLTNEGGSHAV